jgi:tripartite-type tricarboxylate transporter receptor subunit TctC
MTKILRKVGIGVMSAFSATLVLWSLSVSSVLSTEAAAQEYPTKPIRMFVANAPGAGADVIARLIGAKLGQINSGRLYLADGNVAACHRLGDV